MTTRGRIRELQASIGRGGSGARREKEVRELDALVGKEWSVPLCIKNNECCFADIMV